MRKIKFRAWDNNSNSYITFELSSEGKPFVLLPIDEGYTVLKLDNIIVEQFTGLKDKNGVDIYDGDIFHCNKVNYVLRFNQVGGAYTVHKITDEKDERFLFHCNDQIAVIGNIHENPELINNVS